MTDAIAFDLADVVPLGTADDTAFGTAFGTGAGVDAAFLPDLVDAVPLGTEDDAAFGTGAGVALLIVFRLTLPPQSGHALPCSSFDLEPVNKAPLGIFTMEHTQFGVARVGVGALKMEAIKAALPSVGVGARRMAIKAALASGGIWEWGSERIDMLNSGDGKRVGVNTTMGLDKMRVCLVSGSGSGVRQLSSGYVTEVGVLSFPNRSDSKYVRTYVRRIYSDVDRGSNLDRLTTATTTSTR